MRLRRRLEKAEVDAAVNAAMLREGDHRIKNSLQIIVSMLRLQARSDQNPEALLSAAGRIETIARVHDALGRTGNSGNVDVDVLLRTMCASIVELLEDTGIGIEVHLEPVQIPAAAARSVLLAVNELLINAIRHAYPRGRKGVIRVSLRREGEELRIAVADDGAGIVPNRVGRVEGYGLKLVRLMTEQLGGALCINNSAGAKVSMIIPTDSPLLR
jgi:two-component sensor histidine kinase